MIYKKFFFILLTFNILVLLVVGIILFKYRALIITRVRRIWNEPGSYALVEYKKQQLYNQYSQSVTYVMLGNSITQQAQWHELLQQKDLVNRAISGETVKGMLQRLPTILALKPRMIFVMGGINDIVYHGASGGTVFNTYKQLLDSISTGGVVPVITSTLFVTYSEQINQQVEALNQLLLQHCEQQQLRYIDLNSKLSKDGLLLPDYSYDGIHLNDKAYLIWRNELYAIIREKKLP